MKNVLCSMRSVNFVLCFALVLSSASSCDRRSNIVNIGSKGKTIVAFGDSVTLGLGVSQEGNYPYFLGQKLGIDIINAGVSGETTAAALKRLERDVLALDPKIVIVEFGANDFFQKTPFEETLQNVRAIIDRIHKKKAVVVLVSVKMELMKDSYGEAYKELAEEKGAVFVPNVLKGIITTPSLKVDQIHPNEAGYRIIADRIHKRIKFLLPRHSPTS